MHYSITPVVQRQTGGSQRIAIGDLIHFSAQGNPWDSIHYLEQDFGMTQHRSSWLRLHRRNSLLASMGEEGYSLTVDPLGILIEAPGDRGIFYGIQSLIQILDQENARLGQKETVLLWECRIEDKPRFAWRGFMLDSARHFHGPQDVKKLLRAMALLKMNRFHWHLSDDQGWRIESPSYPRLNQIGSWRRGSQCIDKIHYNEAIHGGYFTRAQIREILELARRLKIDVIPELDIPGHCGAALAALPELSCYEGSLEVPRDFGILNHMVCAGKDRSMEIIQGLIQETAELFPGKYFHLGGDETQLKSWMDCPHCAGRMEELGISSHKDLLYWFLNKQKAVLRSMGKIPVLWNDKQGWNNQGDHILQYWIEDQGGLLRETQQGRPVIVSFHKQYYLDYPHSFISLRDCYGPVPLADSDSCNILGIEAAIWTEWVDSPGRLYWQIFPRMVAVAESAWSRNEQKNWEDFLSRLKGIFRRLEALGIELNELGVSKDSLEDPWDLEYEEQLRLTEDEYRRAHEGL